MSEETGRILLERLNQTHVLTRAEYLELLQCRFERQEPLEDYLFGLARDWQKRIFGNKIYVRGLIEFTNVCRNNCYYCGIRRDNRRISRYRLTKEQILNCCETGWRLGYRTFVLQGGEDPYFTDDRICDIVGEIKHCYPDCAVTLSIGEREYDSYKRFREAGADRYLLRHETANPEHYARLHPQELSLNHRLQCLNQLKELGYQVGAGGMIGSPGQTLSCLADDLYFLQELKPQMIGIGPYITQKDTPFSEAENGSVEQTLFLLAVLRIMFPNVLLPATTALGSLDASGRERGILAGANVIMPNLSPVSVREKYQLYDNKICMGEEAAECMECIRKRVEAIGYEIVVDRGDYPQIINGKKA